MLTVEREEFDLTEGDAIFVPAGAEQQFTGYVELSVLVFFAKTDHSGELSMLMR